MANKVMSLHDAVEKYVHDNDVLCLGGFTTNRKPYAAVYEILRQGKTGFVGWSGPAGGDWDSLIGEGRVRAYINCYTANSGYTIVSVLTFLDCSTETTCKLWLYKRCTSFPCCNRER